MNEENTLQSIPPTQPPEEPIPPTLQEKVTASNDAVHEDVQAKLKEAINTKKTYSTFDTQNNGERISIPLENIGVNSHDFIEKSNTTSIKPLRTYESDVAEAIKNKNVSVINIAVAEAQKTQKKDEVRMAEIRENPAPPKSSFLFKNIISVIVSIILVVIGGWMGYYFYSTYIVTQDLDEKKPTIPTIIKADSQKQVKLTDTLNLRNLLISAKENEAVPATSILNIYVTETKPEGNVIVPTVEFLQSLNVAPPPELVRSLEKNYMLGIHSWSGNQFFMIFKTNFYQNAFAGMLKWEKYFEDEWTGLLLPKEETVVPTTSREIIKPPTPFEDVVIKNKDARALRDIDGKIIFLYSFADTGTLVFATNENTFKEILVRLEKTTFSR